ncbi:hypothetical protein BDQ17DRAFT_1353464 [Cyathus striatus]|nr:hypothetical protein BDQ17DRAFT_1353464 [Cyathus striatus]
MNSRRPGLPSNPRCQLSSSSNTSFAREHVSGSESASDVPLVLPAPSTKQTKTSSEHVGHSISLRKELPSSSPTKLLAARHAQLPRTPLTRTSELVPNFDQRTDSPIAEEKNLARGTPSPLRTPDINQEAVSTYTAPNLGSNGYNVWNRVTDVANSLTINVSKAWSSTVISAPGEVTPPGQDSHLIRVMKAYHISKARELSDLPAWLFTDRERRANAHLVTDGANDDERTQQVQVTAQKTLLKSEGAYDTNEMNTSLRTSRLRGADRLKAMRDSKRSGQAVAIALPARLDTK